MERRLAAILSADVVGYSRLMGEQKVKYIARPIRRIWTCTATACAWPACRNNE